MTTTIYFFLMSLSIFIIPQLFVKFFHGEVKYNKDIRYLVYASLLPFIWHIFVPMELNSLRIINFLQHAIGGGVAIGFVSLYLINVLKRGYDVYRYFWFQVVFVYLLVSGFGVANEILEFGLDWFGIGIFSADRYDVWFDLVANTLGAMSVFLFYRFVLLFSRK